MGYIGMCDPIGYGFSAVLVINRVWILHSGLDMGTFHGLRKSRFLSLSKRNQQGEQGWRSGKSARLPPMFPWFDSRTWVEFVVGSRPCSEGSYPGFPVFLPPQKSTFLNIPTQSGIRGPRVCQS